MSNEEKQLRDEHFAYRKRGMLIFLSCIAFVALVLIATIYGYKVNQESIYIEYVESSNVDYKVYLKENDFYEEEYMGKDQSYVASLIDNISADFNYQIDMGTDNVEYRYTYSVDALFEIFDNEYKKPIYNPVTTVVSKKSYVQNSSKTLSIKENVTIDYHEYNQKALDFVAAYELYDIDCCVTLRMHISVISVCADYVTESTDEYMISLSIPLTNKTTGITFSSSVPTSERQMLACSNASSVAQGFKVGALIAAGIEVAVIIGFVVFMVCTRDKNTDYQAKVQRIIRNYKSYIQQINNPFVEEGYQVLKVNTFEEMLDIRDTLQFPILSYENEDKTCTKFFIHTNNKVLYLYQVSVIETE